MCIDFTGCYFFWCRPPMTCRAWLNFLLTRVPIIRWIIGYQPFFIVGDIISGITVAIMHIPQGKCSRITEKIHPLSTLSSKELQLFPIQFNLVYTSSLWISVMSNCGPLYMYNTQVIWQIHMSSEQTTHKYTKYHSQVPLHLLVDVVFEPHGTNLSIAIISYFSDQSQACPQDTRS